MPQVQLNTRISIETYNAIKEFSESNKIPLAKIVQEALDKYLKENHICREALSQYLKKEAPKCTP